MNQNKIISFLKKVSQTRLAYQIAAMVIGVLFIIVWLIIVEMPTAPKRKLVANNQACRMLAVSSAASAYSILHQNVFPSDLNEQFLNQIRAASMQERISLPSTSEWLKIRLVKDRTEALKCANRFLGPEQILYCVLKPETQVQGYLVLGTDEHGKLLSLSGKDPLILSSDDKPSSPAVSH